MTTETILRKASALFEEALKMGPGAYVRVNAIGLVPVMKAINEKLDRMLPSPLTMRQISNMYGAPVYDAIEGTWRVIDDIVVCDEICSNIEFTYGTIIDTEGDKFLLYAEKPE